jgi:hypothetical protein
MVLPVTWRLEFLKNNRNCQISRPRKLPNDRHFEPFRTYDLIDVLIKQFKNNCLLKIIKINPGLGQHGN